VTAHPNDVDFGAAGSVATWTGRGIDVSYCIATDGDAEGPTLHHAAEMAAIRRESSWRRPAPSGVTDVTFLDSRTAASPRARAPGRHLPGDPPGRPDRVVSQSPERNWERIYASHPDHLATAEAAACAVYPDARNPFASRAAGQGLEPHTVPSCGSWPRAANRVVDATDAYDRKLTALRPTVAR